MLIHFLTVCLTSIFFFYPDSYESAKYCFQDKCTRWHHKMILHKFTGITTQSKTQYYNLLNITFNQQANWLLLLHGDSTWQNAKLPRLEIIWPSPSQWSSLLHLVSKADSFAWHPYPFSFSNWIPYRWNTVHFQENLSIQHLSYLKM